MDTGLLTERAVADHYRRHCVHGPRVDRLLGAYFACYPDRVPVGAVSADLLADVFSWARTRTEGDGGTPDGLGAVFGDLDTLEAHTGERAELMALLDQAAEAYTRAHGRPGVTYATGGVTADQVHLYSTPDGTDALTMPIPWALAYHATLTTRR